MPRDSLPRKLVRRVRQAAQSRCGYRRCPQDLVPATFEIEHIIPLARGGTNEESNLWLSCPLCNRHKGDRVAAIDPETGSESALFHPRLERWSEHFRWSEDGLRIVGLTPTGRATVAALHLDDDPLALAVRANWILAGWHPPAEA
jgi:hypothetical protein